jgi:type IV secretory pathway TraG/TraD family ATPase VirD4
VTVGFVVALTAVVLVGLACGAWRAVSTGEPAAGEGHWRELGTRPAPGRGQGWRSGSFRGYPARLSPGYPPRQYPSRSSGSRQARSGRRQSKSRLSRARVRRGGFFQAGSLFKRSPLVDRRDRHGFASSRQLRQEASVAAARKRAAQTRPSLRATRGRSRPEEIGYPLGRAHPGGMPLWPSWEASLRLVAPPGEGKTFRALVPVLRQHPGPAIATSTKADLYELSAIARQRRGPVFALDPDLLAPAAEPARWSPVSGCEQSEVAERRAAALVAATGDDSDAQNGAFFRDSARDLLKAYLHAAALEGLDIRSVLDWSRRPDDPAPAEVLLSSPLAAEGWDDLVGLHTSGAPETTSGVLRYVARALACFSHEAVIEACCPQPGEALDIEQFLIDNGTIYLLGKGSRLGAVAPLITAFADEVFDCAERLAATMPNRRLDPPLLGLLDEAPSIAPVPSLPELLADGRGRGIVIVYAMQSFSQAVTRWGAQRAETMGNATSITAVLGGLTSPTDLADLERICGQRRVRRVSTHRGSGGRNGRDHSRTISWESEAVLRADQIRTLQAGMALLLWSRLPPVLVHLPLLSELADWEQVRQEEEQARLANDRARSLARPTKRHYPSSEMFLGEATFPDGPLPVPAAFPDPSPVN